MKEDNLSVSFRGEHTLSQINGAMVVGNHYCISDWYFVQQAIKQNTGKDTYPIAAEFNNRSDWVGDFIRAQYCLPLCNKGHFGQSDAEKQSIREILNNTISFRLKNGDNIYVASSGTMWRMYKKPQPSHSGAFNWAIHNNKPVLPVFATYKQNGEHDELNPEINKDITVHFGEPIQPDASLSRNENLSNMIRQVFLWQKNIYESEYQTELNYNCSPKLNDLVKSGVKMSEIKAAFTEISI